MRHITRSVSAKQNQQPEEPVKQRPKIKLNVGQVQAAIQLVQVRKQENAIAKAATIEAGLCQAKEMEIQEALQVNRSVASGDVSETNESPERTTDEPPEPTKNDGVDERGSCSSIKGKTVGGLREGTPLVFHLSGLMNRS